MKTPARLFICFLAAGFLAGGAPAVCADTQCIVCHRTLGEKHAKILSDFDGDIHKKAGLSCHSCHGGNPNASDMAAAMSPEAGFAGAPSPQEVPAFCGKCHSKPAFMKKFNPALPVDQEEKYWTSMHGRRLKSGDTNAATCGSCHPPHSIRAPDDPLSSVYAKNIAETCGRCHSDRQKMSPYKIPTDQKEKYLKSVHANALYKKGDAGAPTCNDCHGNHGATPPGVENIATICGHCHVHNLELFQASPMAKTWEKRGYHACATCHNHHDVMPPTLAMLSGENAVCLRCHNPSGGGWRAKGYQTGARMKQAIESLQNEHSELTDFVDKIEARTGMDVTEAKDRLQESRQALIQAKTAVHGFNAEKVDAVVGQGKDLLANAREIARRALQEFWRRRIGLGVASLFITLLALAITLKLKDIEKP